jgi:hypothetical protein
MSRFSVRLAPIGAICAAIKSAPGPPMTLGMRREPVYRLIVWCRGRRPGRAEPRRTTRRRHIAQSGGRREQGCDPHPPVEVSARALDQRQSPAHSAGRARVGFQLDIAGGGEQAGLISRHRGEPSVPQIAAPALAEIDVPGITPRGLAQGRAQAPHRPAPGSDALVGASGNTPTPPPMRRRIQPPAVRCRSRKPSVASTSVSDDPLLAQPLRIFGTGAAERTR